MKVIQIDQACENIEDAVRSLKVAEKAKPKPGPGQVLVKMAAAPCNPSDLLFLSGKYGVKKTYPAVPGWEGAGTVVENGGGALGWWLKGKRVACGGQADSDGTWAEYYVADARACVPLHDAVSFEQGATLLINPLTAVGMMEEAKRGRHQAIIQNAAVSQVGRLLHTLAKKEGIPLINIVRRKEQAESVRQDGGKWVLDSSEDTFGKELKELSHKLGATIAFDAVGGEMTGVLLNVMPEKSTAFVYGALAGKPCGGVSPLSLIFQGKSVQGFWLSQWIRSRGSWHTFQATRKVQQLVGSGSFQTKIRMKASPDQWVEALLAYQKEMSKGKVLLSF